MVGVIDRPVKNNGKLKVINHRFKVKCESHTGCIMKSCTVVKARRVCMETGMESAEPKWDGHEIGTKS